MAKKFNIVYCIGSLVHPGGTEKVLASKANYMVNKLGHEVHIIIIDQLNAPLCYDFSPKIKIHDIALSKTLDRKVKIPGITYLQNISDLKKIYTKKIEQINPDVILTLERGYHDFFIPYICKNIPKIREFHFSKKGVDYKAKLMNTLKQRLRYKVTYKMLFEQFKKYDKLVLLTNVDQKEGNYTDNTMVIGNMIEKYPETYSDTTPKKVISVGSMDDDRKGFIKQIMIWEKIAKSFPDWTLNIYGGGVRSTYYNKLIEEKNLVGKVILHGKSSEIPKKMEESSIFIMTSEAEGLPMVLIEAMSSGLPCVSYDCPTGPSDIINDGVDGFVIDLNNEDQFIDKLKLLMQEDITRKEFGKHARENGKRYLPNVIMPKWEKLFEELTN